MLSAAWSSVSVDYVRHFPNCAAMVSRFGVPPNIVQQWNVMLKVVCCQVATTFMVDFLEHSAILLQHSKLHVCWCPKKWSFCSLLHLQLRVFLDNLIEEMKTELPAYLAAATDVDSESDISPLSWWKQHASELPNWASAAKQVALVQLSSAAAERVFSLLNN